MAYYTQVLQPGETVRVVGRVHWFVYRSSVILLIATLGVLVAGGMATTPQMQQALLVLGAVLALLTLGLFLGQWLYRRSIEIVVTDLRVIYKRGIVGRHTVEMNVSKVETVDVEQGIAGRMFGYGTVLIRGTGASIEPLRGVAEPLAIRNAITVG